MPPEAQWLLDHAFAIAAGACAIVGFAMAARGALLHRASASWARATGRITHASLDIDSNREFDTTEHRPPVFIARIRYTFTDAAGVQHTSHTVHLGADLHTSSRDRAERTLAIYHEGDAVDVWYDPRNPDRCCLERESSEIGFGLLLGIGGLVFAAGSLLVNG